MRIIRSERGFEIVDLNKVEKTRLLEKLRTENKELMQLCMADAIKLCEQMKTKEVQACANALFSKLAGTLYGLVKDAETMWVFNLKRTAGSPAWRDCPEDGAKTDKEAVAHG